MTSPFLQFLLSGLTAGAVVGIAALSLTIVFRVSGILNLAQGEFITLGALGSWFLAVQLGWPRYFAIATATLAVIALSLVLAKGTVLPAQRRLFGLIRLVLITLALTVALQGLSFLIFGRDARSATPFLSTEPIRIGGAVVSTQAVLLFVVTGIIAGLLAYTFHRTLIGKAMTACPDNRTGAASVGIDVSRMTLVAFGLAAGLGALSGAMLMPIRSFDYLTGFGLAMHGLAAAALVGMRSPVRALGSGLVIGSVQGIVAGYMSSAYQPVIVFGLLIAVLLIWPRLVPPMEH